MSVQRYRVHYRGWPEESPDGDHVLYTDYAPVERERDELRAQLQNAEASRQGERTALERKLDQAEKERNELRRELERVKFCVPDGDPSHGPACADAFTAQQAELLALREVAEAAQAYTDPMASELNQDTEELFFNLRAKVVKWEATAKGGA